MKKLKIYVRYIGDIVDPWRVEAECQECGKEYELTSEKHDLDFLKDVAAGLTDVILEYHKLNSDGAANKVED